MERIKLFEEFIFETSSKKLEDINKGIKDLIKGVSPLDLEFTMLYILYANEDADKISRISSKVDRMRKAILLSGEFKFDMGDAIKTYKEMLIHTRGKIKSMRWDHTEEYFEMSDIDKKSLEAVENIFDHYKKQKNNNKVDFSTFAKYIYKIIRVLGETDKDSEKSRENIIQTIVKNGINVPLMYKEMSKYTKDGGDLVVLPNIVVRPGDEFTGNDRHNVTNYPVMIMDLWHKDKKMIMINLSLYVDKKDYIITMGYTGQRYQRDIVAFGNGDAQIWESDKNHLNRLKKYLDEIENEFGKNEFKKIMKDIFKIYADCGAKVEFDYDDMREKINNEADK